MNTEIHHHHDKYFKSAMSDLRVAKEILYQHLPKHILNLINLDSLRIEKSSFVEAHLRHLSTDMLYGIDFDGQEGYLYLLAEHQSTPDERMPFRLLRYMTAIMYEHMKRKGLPLPVVIPLVLYNGWKKYNYSTDLFKLFGEQESLARSIFLQPFQLVHVRDIPDEELKKYPWAGLMELMQKHFYDEDISPLLKEIARWLKDLASVGAREYIVSTITYLKCFRVDNVQEAIKIIHKSLRRNGGKNDHLG